MQWNGACCVEFAADFGLRHPESVLAVARSFRNCSVEALFGALKRRAGGHLDAYNIGTMLSYWNTLHAEGQSSIHNYF